MLSKLLEKEINDQINYEFWSAQLYLSMSAHFSDLGLPGFAHWMYIQYQEETTHAIKFFNYVIERGGKAEVQPIKAVPTNWDSVLGVFEETMEHEQKVTARINHLADTAVAEKDHATQSMLRWFIDEQVEEEANVKAIVDTLKLVKDNGYAIYSLDKELAARVFVDSTQTGSNA
ncbi:ferritin [Paludibacter jiangxiensis]|uniref:Ferritin n=1 Tax=Paludibacter jiangxiensis TaxID=681398 RepID=A0A161LDR7_9BACT|nr:ferritin [Paludibacter jiangxiensis]GAT62177.1 ferritin [Paludibacter jiangxiensis]